jgi:hypothetical protein
MVNIRRETRDGEHQKRDQGWRTSEEGPGMVSIRRGTRDGEVRSSRVGPQPRDFEELLRLRFESLGGVDQHDRVVRRCEGPVPASHGPCEPRAMPTVVWHAASSRQEQWRRCSNEGGAAMEAATLRARPRCPRRALARRAAVTCPPKSPDAREYPECSQTCRCL